MVVGSIEHLIASSGDLERGFGRQFVEAAILSLQSVSILGELLVASWDDLSVEAQVVTLWYLSRKQTKSDFPWEILFRGLLSPDVRVGGMAAGAFSHRGSDIEIDRLALMFAKESTPAIRSTILCAIRDAGDIAASMHKVVTLLEIAQSGVLTPREQAYVVEGLAYAMQNLDKSSTEYNLAIQFLCETVLKGPWSDEGRSELVFVLTVTRDEKLQNAMQGFREGKH